MHTHGTGKIGMVSNRRKQGILRTIKRVCNKISLSVFMENFEEGIKENFQAKLSEITDTLRHKYMLKTWTDSKAVEK